jgi:hypothetical protein
MKQLLPAILLAFALNANAQTTNRTVVPLGLENQNGNSNDGIIESGGQFQELFRSSYLQAQWQTPVQITGMAFRVDGALSSDTVIPRVEIRLSTSLRSREDMSLIYSANRGGDETTVFLHDNFRLFGSAVRPVSPFDLRFEFDQPFIYDPKAGNLLLYMNSAGPIGSGSQIDAHFGGDVAYVGTSGPFSPDQVVAYSPVIQFSWISVPEPSTLCLGALGGLIILGLRKN